MNTPGSSRPSRITTDRVSGCQGKVGFPNGALAWRVTKRQTRRGDSNRKIYRCPFCGQWHQGHADDR